MVAWRRSFHLAWMVCDERSPLRDDAVPEKGTRERDDAKPSREEIVSHLLGGVSYFLPMGEATKETEKERFCDS
jgi:hypothetical protein